MLYVDERADPDQQRALEEIWAGRVAGEQLEHFPWAWKASNLLGVRPAQIEIDHTPRRAVVPRARRRERAHRGAGLRATRRSRASSPGTNRPGEEMIAEELKVDDGPFQFEYNGVCGYACDFDYRSS